MGVRGEMNNNKMFSYKLGILGLIVVMMFVLNMCIGEGMRREIISGNCIITGRYTMTDSTMTIYEGREISFEEGSATGCDKHAGEFRVSTDATLQCLGDSTHPVTFTGTGSLVIEEDSRDNCILRFCEFGDIAVTINNPATVVSSCTQNGVPYP